MATTDKFLDKSGLEHLWSGLQTKLASKSHSHGNITNAGALQTTDITIASGDKLVVTDASDSNRIARSSLAFDGSTTTKALTPKGTWETFATSNTDTKVTLGAVTSGTTYYPVVGSGTTAATRQFDTTGFAYTGTNGTTSATGTAKITLGNSTSSGTANNKRGQVVIYGTGTKMTTLQASSPSADNTLTLPTGTGTIPYAVSGGGTANSIVVWDSTDTTKLVDGPTFGDSETTFLRNDGEWATPGGGGDVSGPNSSTNGNITLFNGATGKIIKDSGITINTIGTHAVMSGFTTTAGSSTSGSYLSVKWTISGIDGITTPYDGMRVAIKIPLAGVGTAGAVMSIDGGTTYHPLSYNTGVLTTHYAANSVKWFTYDASASMNAYLTAGTATSITGVWRADADYDSNSNNYDRTVVTYGCGKSGSNGVKMYSIVLRKSDDTYESLTTGTGGTGTSKTMNTSASFRLGEMYFYTNNADLAANTAIPNSYLYSIYSPLMDARYSCNCGTTLTGNKPFYLVGTMSNGLFTLTSPYYAQDLPTTADNKVYVFVGRAYDTYRIFLASTHPVFYYSNGAVREYTGLSSAASNTTGISIADHSTTTIKGVGGTTTIYSKSSGGNGSAPTLGTAFTVPNVTSAGSASTWTFESKSIPNVTSAGSASTWTFEEKSIPNVTAAGSGSFTSGAFSGGSGSFSATVTNHVLSFSHTHTAATHGADSHTHTAPTLGTAIKVQSKSGGSNGTAPTLGTAITVYSKSGGANGSAPTLGTAFTIPNVTSAGSASTWAFESKTVATAAASDTTVVTSKTHIVTDNGHTHTLS